MKTWMIVRSLILFSLLCASQLSLAGGNLLQVDSADASKFNSVKWTEQQFPIVWHLSDGGYPGSGLDNTQLTQSLEQAFNTWAALSNKIQFTNGGTVVENSVGIDGINLLTFTDQDYLFPSGEAAFAINYTFTQETVIDDVFNDIDGDGNRDLPNGIYPPGTIYEADIVFNGSIGFEVTGANGSADLQAIALHEIGHLLGLSHSVIGDTVMYPFQSQDVANARTLKQDDIAFISHIYSFDAGFASSISGKIINGYTGEPVLGAHVFVSSPADGKQIVGAFSLNDGSYFIPGVRMGYVGIEPLDGSPIAKDPARINEAIKDTFDIDFISEFFDSNESNVETSPLSAQLFDLEVAPGILFPAINIDIVTNTSAPPGVGMRLLTGLNVFSYPVETLDGFAAFDLLQALGNESEINSIDHYNATSSQYERVFWQSGLPAGVNFSIKRGEAYLVHMQTEKNVTFEGVQDCPLVKTKAGFNLIGVPCPPSGYSAFDLLTTLGGGAVSVKQYNRETAAFEIAVANTGSVASGNDFPIVNGVGYVIEMLAGQGEVSLTGDSHNFPAFISGISPGRAVTGSRVTILGLGFSEAAAANEVLFNGVRAAVITASANMLAVTVPNAATTGPVTVGTGGAVSNSIEFVVEPRITLEEDVVNRDIIDGQTVQGNLTNNDEQDRYSFIASKGAYITATAIAPAGIPDLILFLEGPSGEILTINDNGAGGTNPEIRRFKLNRTGRYTVVVAALPGTGAGAYAFTLNIENTPAIKDITIISGDAQTGVMGTRLPIPMEVYVTGPEGYAVTGIPITLVTDNAVSVTGNTTAATYQILTNKSGIATISIDLPMVSGFFDINIQIPGYPVKTIRVSAVPSLPVTVEVTGKNQNCGGLGCIVGKQVTNPYQLRFLDGQNNPVKDVVVKFEVVSGDGKIINANANGIYEATSGLDGIVQASHILGNKTKDANGDVPQIVAATTNYTGAEIILFQSTAKADVAIKILSNKTGSLQMTMGTAVLNAVVIEPKDQFGNPVVGADVSVVSSGGLVLEPGFLNGEQFVEMKTNENGIFAGMLVAGFDATPHLVRIGEKYSCSAGGVVCPPAGSSVNLGSVGVAPTIDEFGARVAPQPYTLTLSVDGAIINILVDVDMGPKLIMSTVDALKPGDGAWVGRDFNLPIHALVTTFQRMDECSSIVPPLDEDDDGGDWRDEDFSLSRIRRVNIVNMPHSMTATRVDGVVDTISLDSPRDDYLLPLLGKSAESFEITKQTMINDPVVTITTLISSTVKADNVQGPFNVVVNTDNPGVFDPGLGYVAGFWFPDDVCLEGSVPHAITWSNIATYNGIITIEAPDLTKQKLFVPLISVSPRVEFVVTDFTLTEPVPDPLVSVRSSSGIDLQSLSFSLNNINIFNGTTQNIILDKYPNYIEMYSDGAKINLLTDQMLNSLAPLNFKMIYYPTAGELTTTVPNTTTISTAKDKVGNTISAPETVPFVLP